MDNPIPVIFFPGYDQPPRLAWIRDSFHPTRSWIVFRPYASYEEAYLVDNKHLQHHTAELWDACCFFLEFRKISEDLLAQKYIQLAAGVYEIPMEVILDRALYPQAYKDFKIEPPLSFPVYRSELIPVEHLDPIPVIYFKGFGHQPKLTRFIHTIDPEHSKISIDPPAAPSHILIVPTRHLQVFTHDLWIACLQYQKTYTLIQTFLKIKYTDLASGIPDTSNSEIINRTFAAHANPELIE